MNDISQNRCSDDGLPRSRAALSLLRVLVLAVTAVAGYLAWTALSAGQIAGCGNEGSAWNCDHVLHSRWSKWLGFPVSVPAFLLYLSMFAALMLAGPSSSDRRRRFCWSFLTVAAVMAGAAAVWFMSLQIFIIKGLCPYCVGVHTTGLVILAIVIWQRPFNWYVTSRLALVGCVGIVTLISGQILAEPPETHKIEFFATDGDADTLDVQDENVVGPGSFLNPLDPGPVTDKGREATTSEVSTDDSNRLASTAGGATRRDPLLAPALSPQPAPTEPGVIGVDAPVDKNSRKKPPLPTPTPLPTADNAAEPASRIVKILGGKTTLDVYQWPLIGSAEAAHVMVELFDYTCHHCRTMHEHLKVAHERFGNQFSYVALPLPLNPDCNSAVTRANHQHRHACELARLAVAVWRVNPQAFPGYHDWLFASTGDREPGEAKSKAIELVGADRLQAELNGKMVDKYINLHVDIYKRANRGNVPKLMSAAFTIKGQTSSAEELCRILQQRLELQPVVR